MNAYFAAMKPLIFGLRLAGKPILPAPLHEAALATIRPPPGRPRTREYDVENGRLLEMRGFGARERRGRGIFADECSPTYSFIARHRRARNISSRRRNFGAAVPCAHGERRRDAMPRGAERP